MTVPGQFGLEFGNKGIANDTYPTPCSATDSRDIPYLTTVFKFVTDQPKMLDKSKIFTEGSLPLCSSVSLSIVPSYLPCI